jgi:hypothetical protein
MVVGGGLRSGEGLLGVGLGDVQEGFRGGDDEGNDTAVVAWGFVNAAWVENKAVEAKYPSALAGAKYSGSNAVPL